MYSYSKIMRMKGFIRVSADLTARINANVSTGVH